MSIDLSTLQGYVGKTMADICSNGFADSAQNHCAHFVSHVLGITLGVRCGDMTYETRRTGGSIRVDEIYNQLAVKGDWADRPSAADGLLIFVLSARNVTRGVMRSVPQKHVGVYHGGTVYHYSNGQQKVVADPSVDVFHAKFDRIYAGKDISLYYGVAP